ncbi:MAG: DmsC/YnfH family molybdoenzyme membrane anchor subunit [Pseudomonadota bacterium]
MKPAPSIIGFTALSGLGYGLLFVLAVGVLAGLVPTDRWLGVAGFLLALGSITAGLFASTLHLGHPERAWRAISQWRSSWLSREGLAALITYIPAVIFAIGWVVYESIAGLYVVMALASAAGAAATVWCTGMIYASLPPIKAWHQPLTAPVYLALALMTGLLATNLLLILFGAPRIVVGILTLIAIAGAAALKIVYWLTLSNEGSSGPNAASATGLSRSGLVRMLDPPHTQTNYLLDEMGFQIGRKHAQLLKLLTCLFGLVIPLALTAMTLMQDHWLVTLLALLAFASGMIAVLIERWLFFAEAEHTVMLYYGNAASTAGAARTVSSIKPSRRDVSISAEEPRRRRASPVRRRATNIAMDEADPAS